MKEEILRIVENYEMGFISPLDFLMQYRGILALLGAHKCIEDKISEELQEMANDVAAMLKSGNKNNNMVEHYGSCAFN